MQTTNVNNHIILSKKVVINYGVTQGSILGPLLFLLYKNDISTASKVLKFHLFADDTNILFSNKCLKTIEREINKELTKLQNWFTTNKLTINIKKSNFVLFQSAHNKQ